MNSKLENIDWKGRNAEYIPVWLNQLRSNNQTERAEAKNNLEDTVIRIGNQNFDMGHGISELLSTDLPTLVAPFLIDLLEDENTPDKVSILDMLIGLSLYSTMKFEGDVYQKRLSRLLSVIYRANQLYIKLLKNINPTMRASAFSILCQNPNMDEPTKQALRKARENESDNFAKEFMERIWKQKISAQ